MFRRLWGEAGGRRRRGACQAFLSAGLAVLAAAGAANAAPSAHITRIGPAAAGQSLRLVFPLAADEGGLARLAALVSTPGSGRYGRYEPIAELARRYGASPRTRARVLRFLRRAGARDVKIDATGLFARATLSVGRAERLFATHVARFALARHGQFTAPTSAVHVPAPLRGSVTGVVGLDTRPLASGTTGLLRDRHGRAHAAASQPSSALPHSGTATGCAAGTSAGEQGGDPSTAGFTPNQYLTAYGFDPLHAAGLFGQGERAALIEIDGFRDSDIQAFAQCFGFDIPQLNGFGVGVPRPLAPGGESTLDIEVLDATAPDLKAIDVYETRPTAADVLTALTAPLQNKHYKPQVVSASLGLCEPAVFEAVGLRGLEATEAALEMSAISGISFLASSGDQGSADCTAPDGTPIDRLAINYPAASPWATSTGGTNLQLTSANQISNQLVWNDAQLQPGAAGGGGLSDLFKRPGYQAGTVGPNRRGVPDVSMLADVAPGYAVYCSAQGDCINSSNSNPWQTVGGTSAGTPLLAGGFALVDQALRASRRQDLGLANPLLYKLGRDPSLASGVFSDVTAYGNDIGPFIGDGQPLGCCTATPGYDTASGWGSVNLAAFAQAAQSLQPPLIGLSLPSHQRPVRQRKILARVSCAGACRIGAIAEVQIGHKRAFEVDSRIYTLAGAASKTIAIHFSSRQLARLRAALQGHQRVVATVSAVLITGRKTVQSLTAGKKLTIRS